LTDGLISGRKVGSDAVVKCHVKHKAAVAGLC